MLRRRASRRTASRSIPTSSRCSRRRESRSWRRTRSPISPSSSRARSTASSARTSSSICRPRPSRGSSRSPAEKLAEGGVLVLETPNPESLVAGSVNFHRDLTHVRPIHPDTLAFLCRERGLLEGRDPPALAGARDERLPTPGDGKTRRGGRAAERAALRLSGLRRRRPEVATAVATAKLYETSREAGDPLEDVPRRRPGQLRIRSACGTKRASNVPKRASGNAERTRLVEALPREVLVAEHLRHVHEEDRVVAVGLDDERGAARLQHAAVLRSARSGSSMWWSESFEWMRSNSPSPNGSSSASATENETRRSFAPVLRRLDVDRRRPPRRAAEEAGRRRRRRSRRRADARRRESGGRACRCSGADNAARRGVRAFREHETRDVSLTSPWPNPR